MDQVYSTQDALIVILEGAATKKGFIAARAGAPNAPENKNTSPYFHDSWKHGWQCWHLNIMPYQIERALTELYGGDAMIAARSLFETSGALTPEFEKLLNNLADEICSEDSLLKEDI